MDLLIRPAAKDDLNAISFIYQNAVGNRQTAHTIPPQAEYWEQWLDDHNDKYPGLVILSEKKVIGFASISPYREGRQALEKVAELSYYLHPAFQGRGIGKFLAENIIKRAEKSGFSHLVAILLGSNLRSAQFLEKLGFEKWGELPDVADFGAFRTSHMYFGKRLERIS